jgi:hypothetical protein
MQQSREEIFIPPNLETRKYSTHLHVYTQEEIKKLMQFSL